jgi:hypothetical protein
MSFVVFLIYKIHLLYFVINNLKHFECLFTTDNYGFHTHLYLVFSIYSFSYESCYIGRNQIRRNTLPYRIKLLCSKLHRLLLSETNEPTFVFRTPTQNWYPFKAPHAYTCTTFLPLVSLLEISGFYIADNRCKLKI